MSDIKLKSPKQQKTNHNQEKSMEIETDPEMKYERITQHLKTAIVNFVSIFKDIKENINALGRKMKHIKKKRKWNIQI